jgi:tetratricopeptide (TPR) repeat protein
MILMRFPSSRKNLRTLLCPVLWLLSCSSSLAQLQTVVILPFANQSKHAGLHWMSESFPELLEDRLKWPKLNVLGRDERLLAFDRIGIPYSSSLSQASLIKVGQELDADILVLGSFDSDGTQMKATASILDLRKNVLKARLEEKAPLDQFQAACGRLAWKILAQLNSMFPLSLNAFIEKFPVIPNIALENYVRGLIESDRVKQIRFLRQADKEYANYSKPIYQLGRLYHQERDYPTSTLWLQRLLKLEGDLPEASFLIGLNHLYLKNYDKAAAEFDGLSRVVPVSAIYTNLAIALSLKGSKQAASEVFEKAIAGDPSEADYDFNLAYHRWKTGDFAGALKNLTAFKERNDSDADVQYLLSKCYRAMGRSEESASALALAQELNPKIEGWETRRQMPDLFRVQSGFDASSFRQLQLHVRQTQENKSAAALKDPARDEFEPVQAMMAAKRFDEAEKVLSQTIQREPASARAHLLMAQVLEARGDRERAISELRASLWLKEDTAVRLRLSQLYLALQRLQEAETQARKILELEPGNQAARDILAKAAKP